MKELLNNTHVHIQDDKTIVATIQRIGKRYVLHMGGCSCSLSSPIMECVVSTLSEMKIKHGTLRVGHAWSKGGRKAN